MMFIIVLFIWCRKRLTLGSAQTVCGRTAPPTNNMLIAACDYKASGDIEGEVTLQAETPGRTEGALIIHLA